MGWTTIAPGVDWTYATIIDEYNRALCQRWYVIAPLLGIYDPSKTFTATAINDDIQDYYFWSTFQSWLQNYCIYFSPNVVTLDGSYSMKSRYTGLADILPNGFRRVDKYGNPGYGFIEAGDELGYWIFEDIQTVFNALTIVYYDAVKPYTNEVRYSPGYGVAFAYPTVPPDPTNEEVMQNAKESAYGTWPEDPVAFGSYGPMAYMELTVSDYHDGGWYGTPYYAYSVINRHKGTLTVHDRVVSLLSDLPVGCSINSWASYILLYKAYNSAECSFALFDDFAGAAEGVPFMAGGGSGIPSQDFGSSTPMSSSEWPSDPPMPPDTGWTMRGYSSYDEGFLVAFDFTEM